jgi:hypothetical protein
VFTLPFPSVLGRRENCKAPHPLAHSPTRSLGVTLLSRATHSQHGVGRQRLGRGDVGEGCCRSALPRGIGRQQGTPGRRQLGFTLVLSLFFVLFSFITHAMLLRFGESHLACFEQAQTAKDAALRRATTASMCVIARWLSIGDGMGGGGVRRGSYSNKPLLAFQVFMAFDDADGRHAVSSCGSSVVAS